MKQKHNHSAWQVNPILAGRLKPWLIDKGSLTLRLQKNYPIFRVKSLRVNHAKPIIDEAFMLNLPIYKTAFIREVLLLGNQQPVVFAHSVLPRASLRGAWQGLGKLGNQPLGAALFANPRVKRAPLSYKKLLPHQVLYQKATQHLSTKPAYLWARRSVFSLNCANILVTEVFLPQLLSL